MTYSNISFKTAKLLAKLDFDWWTEKSLIKTNSGEEYIVDSKLPIDYPNTYKFIAPIPSLGKLHDWLFERHNIEVNVRKHVSLDLFCEPENGVPVEEIEYSYTTNNWNVHWSIHDGTGQVLPEHYNGNAKSYKKAYDKGLRRGLKILLKSQQNGDV
jgi:hypothetical protein